MHLNHGTSGNKAVFGDENLSTRSLNRAKGAVKELRLLKKSRSLLVLTASKQPQQQTVRPICLVILKALKTLSASLNGS